MKRSSGALIEAYREDLAFPPKSKPVQENAPADESVSRHRLDTDHRLHAPGGDDDLAFNSEPTIRVEADAFLFFLSIRYIR